MESDRPKAPSLTAAPSALVDYQAGQGRVHRSGHDKVGRWGDYSTAVADPNATNGFWISNEYDNGTVKWWANPRQLGNRNSARIDLTGGSHSYPDYLSTGALTWPVGTFDTTQ